MNQDVAGASRLEKLAPLLKFDPDNLLLHRECVALAMQGGEYARALDLVDARLTRHPSEAESLFARTNALIGLGQHADALPLLQSLEEQGIARPAVLQNLATTHYALRQFENSAAYAQQLIAAGEKSPGVVHLAVSSLHFLGDVDAAAKLADEHLSLAQSHGPLAGACAILFYDVEQPEKAAKLAAVALAQNPDSVDGLIVEAALAAGELENDQAFRQYTRVLELSPGVGRAWLGLGLLAMLTQDFAKAKELLGRATELMPQHLGSWHSLAWAHLFSGDRAGAEKYFKHVLDLDRNFSESHGAMAAIHAMKGERAAAEREIEIAERLDRNGGTAQFARALLLEGEKGAAAGREHIFRSVAKLATRGKGKPAAWLADVARKNSKTSG